MDNKDWKREMRDIENEASQPRRSRNDASHRKYNPSYKPNFENIAPQPYEPPPAYAPPEASQTSGLVNPGWIALGFLVVSLVVGYNAIEMMGNSFTNSFCQRNEPELNLKAGVVVIALCILGFLISIAVAGAGIATRRGVIPAWLVIIVFVMPIIYFVGQMLFDFPAFTDFLPINNSPTVGATKSMSDMC